jgi:hypothetical protein
VDHLRWDGTPFNGANKGSRFRVLFRNAWPSCASISTLFPYSLSGLRVLSCCSYYVDDSLRIGGWCPCGSHRMNLKHRSLLLQHVHNKHIGRMEQWSKTISFPRAVPVSNPGSKGRSLPKECNSVQFRVACFRDVVQRPSGQEYAPLRRSR